MLLLAGVMEWANELAMLADKSTVLDVVVYFTLRAVIRRSPPLL